MLKGTFAAALMLAAGVAAAQSAEIKSDGCAELAKVVYSEVQSSALYGPGQSGPWVIDSVQGDVRSCSTVAKTVSQAFTSAMQSVGEEVWWGEIPDARGDACLSHYLSQCYPNRGSFAATLSFADGASVAERWAEVTRNVMREMHNPYSSDEIRFRPGVLKLRLGLSLRNMPGERRNPRLYVDGFEQKQRSKRRFAHR